ncbi:MAG: hypothetical protein AB1758_04790, partial [Candidatus Eremiobacterota bacterium]
SASSARDWFERARRVTRNRAHWRQVLEGDAADGRPARLPDWVEAEAVPDPFAVTREAIDRAVASGDMGPEESQLMREYVDQLEREFQSENQKIQSLTR